MYYSLYSTSEKSRQASFWPISLQFISCAAFGIGVSMRIRIDVGSPIRKPIVVGDDTLKGG